MVNPGIYPLSITRGIAFEQIIFQCKDKNVTVTGTLNPDATGTYVPSGNYNGLPLFILNSTPAFFIFYSPTYNNYVLARSLTDGALADGWFPAPAITEPTGSYAPAGTYTGTATVTDHPVDLTNFTVEAHARREPGEGEVIVDFNPSITDVNNGEITIPAMTKVQTAAIDFTGSFHWDLVLIDQVGNRDLVAVKGSLTISDNVTQGV